jgi:HD-GYP domain-containing protein (c-di-GMP phosphodiesterase class II)
VLRNADAMVLLSRMKRHDAYIYQHSVGAAVLGLAFARHLGLDRQAIQEVGLGCLLFDVGKTQLPGELLYKAGALSAAERRVAMAHVDYSLEILERTDGVTERVLGLVRSHHERFDGSGCPAGLRGNQIPTFAKIAGVVDCYDALISERPYAARRTPYEAVREVYAWRGTLFQPEVVERFMQVVGAFPVGSLVELNTGAVGVVVAQNEVRRLRPRLMILTDAAKRRLAAFQSVDLLMDEGWNDAGKVWIERPLDAGAHGIDPDELYI